MRHSECLRDSSGKSTGNKTKAVRFPACTQNIGNDSKGNTWCGGEYRRFRLKCSEVRPESLPVNIRGTTSGNSSANAPRAGGFPRSAAVLYTLQTIFFFYRLSMPVMLYFFQICLAKYTKTIGRNSERKKKSKYGLARLRQTIVVSQQFPIKVSTINLVLL